MKNIHDLTGGFNLYKTSIFNRVKLDEITSNGYSFQIEMKFKTLQSGFKFKEVPIIFKDRELGKSKFSGDIIKEAIVKPWKLRFGVK
jgi:dolichol-phosphate mannosyltransferase